MKLPWWLPVGPVPEISPQKFHHWLDADRPVQVVDARTGLEFAQGTIGAARHAPVTELPGALEQMTFIGTSR